MRLLEDKSRLTFNKYERFTGSFFKFRAFDANDSKFFKYVKAMIKNGQVFYASFSSLNDIFEGVPSVLGSSLTLQLPTFEGGDVIFKPSPIEMYTDTCSIMTEYEVQAILDNSYGIFSASMNINSILQWSYYAAGHTGICLEYKTTPDLFGYKVVYSSKRPEMEVKLNFLNNISRAQLNQDDIQEIIITKASEWHHEREVRFLETEPGLRNLKNNLVAIHLGIKCSARNKEIIRNWLDESGQSHIPIYRMVKCLKDFRIASEMDADKSLRLPTADYQMNMGFPFKN